MKIALIVPLAALALAGCQEKSQAPAAPATPAAAAPAPAEPKAAPAATAHAVDEGCTGDHGTEALQHEQAATVTDPASGATVTAAGAKLAGLPVVSLAEVTGKPDDYVGKTVRLEGNVSAMCHHMRGWFAVQEEGRNGALVRVITTPSFLVPAGSIGKKVRTEGVVEFVQVSAGAARHYAKDHQVGDPAAVQDDAPVKSVIVRATGAEFL